MYYDFRFANEFGYSGSGFREDEWGVNVLQAHVSRQIQARHFSPQNTSFSHTDFTHSGIFLFCYPRRKTVKNLQNTTPIQFGAPFSAIYVHFPTMKKILVRSWANLANNDYHDI